VTDPADVVAQIKAVLAAGGVRPPAVGYGGYPDDPDPAERRSARIVRQFDRELSRAVKHLDADAAHAATERLLERLAATTSRRAITDHHTGDSPRTGATP